MALFVLFGGGKKFPFIFLTKFLNEKNVSCVNSILHRSEEFGLFAESAMYVSRVFFTKC